MNSCASLFLECIYTEVAQRINRKHFSGRRQRGCVCGKRRETGQSPRRPVHRLTRPVDGVCQVRTVCRRRRSGVEGGVSLWRELFAFDSSPTHLGWKRRRKKKSRSTQVIFFFQLPCVVVFLSLSASLIILSLSAAGGGGGSGLKSGQGVAVWGSLSFNYLPACPSLLLTHHHLPPLYTHTLSFTLLPLFIYQGETSFLSRHSPGDALSLRTFSSPPHYLSFSSSAKLFQLLCFLAIYLTACVCRALPRVWLSPAPSALSLSRALASTGSVHSCALSGLTFRFRQTRTNAGRRLARL